MIHSRYLYRIIHTSTQQSRKKSILLLQQRTILHINSNNNNKMMHISTICKCSHLLFLSIGGVQAFVNSFHPPRGDNIIGRANKNNIKLGESSGPDALLDLDKKSSSTKLEEEDAGNTATALDDIPRWDPSTVAKETVVLANDEEFIKSLPDKRQYRAITLPNQLTVLLASDPTTDVEAASVHVRAGHFDDPADRAGLAHFHEHSK